MDELVYPVFHKYFFMDVKRIHVCPLMFSPDLNTLSHPEDRRMYAKGGEVDALESVLLMPADISIKKPMIDSAVNVFLTPYWNFLSDAFLNRISASVIMDLSLMVSVYYKNISKLYSQQMNVSFHQTFRKAIDDLQNKKKSKSHREKIKMSRQQEPPNKLQRVSESDTRSDSNSHTNNGENGVSNTSQIMSQSSDDSEPIYMYPLEDVKLDDISMQNKRFHC